MGDYNTCKQMQNIVKDAAYMARAAGEVVSDSLTSPTVWALQAAS
jgi:hypothetical protein